MDALPELPAPSPQLDFPVTEGLRQDMVREYRAMLKDLQQDIAQFLEGTVEPVVKSMTGYIGAVQDKQEGRRGRIEGVMRRLGVPAAAFVEGGTYQHTSDEALRLEAKRLLSEARKRS